MFKCDKYYEDRKVDQGKEIWKSKERPREVVEQCELPF